MSWAALANNQWVSRDDLQDAVDTAVFSLRPGQTIPTGNRWVDKDEVETWLYATVSSGTADQWPQKSWIVADAPIYTVNFHNAADTDVNVTQVHGTGGYIADWVYPIEPGQNRTSSDWPVANWGSPSGFYGEKITPGSVNISSATYIDGILENTETFVFTDSTTHLSFGVDPPPGGAVMDIYITVVP